jgi:hypothetical protein
MRNRDSTVRNVTRLRAGWSGKCGSIPDRDKKFVSSQKVETGSGTHPTFYSKGNGLLHWWQSGRSVKLIIPRHLLPRLRMNGAVPLLLHTTSWRVHGESFLINTRVLQSLTDYFERAGIEFQVDWWQSKLLQLINSLTPKLNPSAQPCLTRFLLGILLLDPCISLICICVKNQQIQQLFIQFINYVW